MIGNRENKAKTPPSLHSCNYLIRCRMAVPDASLETSMCVLSKNVWYQGWASQLALNFAVCKNRVSEKQSRNDRQAWYQVGTEGQWPE